MQLEKRDGAVDRDWSLDLPTPTPILPEPEGSNGDVNLAPGAILQTKDKPYSCSFRGGGQCPRNPKSSWRSMNL